MQGTARQHRSPPLEGSSPVPQGRGAGPGKRAHAHAWGGVRGGGGARGGAPCGVQGLGCLSAACEGDPVRALKDWSGLRGDVSRRGQQLSPGTDGWPTDRRRIEEHAGHERPRVREKPSVHRGKTRTRRAGVAAPERRNDPDAEGTWRTWPEPEARPLRRPGKQREGAARAEVGSASCVVSSAAAQASPAVRTRRTQHVRSVRRGQTDQDSAFVAG